MRTAKSRFLIHRLLTISLLASLVLAGALFRQWTGARGATTTASLPTLRGEAALNYLKNEGGYASLREAVNAARSNTNPSGPTAMMQREARLTADDGAAEDRLGWAVAISGDTAIVGAPDKDIGSDLNQGAAYIFTRSGRTWTQQQKLTVNMGDGFGYDVAISGDTAIVSAVGSDEDHPGSVHVFVRSGATWNWRQRLTGADSVKADLFGHSIAISDDTIIVGAVFDTVGANTFQGSAYIFTPSGDEWTERQKLTLGNGEATDLFGASVDIDRDTAIIGATGANNDKGAAYVYVRSATGWEQRQELRANNGRPNDQFGTAVALSGDTAIIGAPGDDIGSNADQGSAYIFVRSGETWSQQQKLTNADGSADDMLGNSVALSGDTAVIGAALDDLVGEDQGSAHLFSRSGETWSQQARLYTTNGEAEDKFGGAVAISGDSVIAGAAFDDVGGRSDQGSAFVFVVCSRLARQQKLTADSFNFGSAVAISGDTAVVGADFDNVGNNNNQGSAYVYVRDGATWTLQQKLTASIGAPRDLFGYSVAVSGDTVIIGAIEANVGANTDQGSAFIFTRNGTTWTERQRLTSSDGAGFDHFGHAVAISGDTAIVSALDHDIGANEDQGAAYVYVYDGVSWTERQKLTASDGAEEDGFGVSVALSDDTAVIGAFTDNVGGNEWQGSAYVYKHNGVDWTEQQKLTASEGAPSQFFGISVAISGDTAVVGANVERVGRNQSQGSAYIFVRNGAIWTQKQKLLASDGSAGDYFGTSVAIQADTVVIGAVGAHSQGAVYIFAWGAGTWSQLQKIRPPDGVGRFGSSVSFSRDTVMVTDPNAESAYALSCASCPTITLDPETMPNGTAGRPYNQSIAAGGGTEPFNYAVSTGALPPGLALNPVTGAISGTPTRAGSFDFTIKATDDSLCPGRRHYSITIDCPTITVRPANPNLPAGQVGAPYNRTFTSNGGQSPYTFSIGAGALPAGLTLDSSTGVLTGTPTVSGTFSFAVRATDTAGCTGLTAYVLTVNCSTISVNPANPNLPAVTVGSPINGSFTVTGGTAPFTFSITNGALPAGLSLNPATGEVSGTPAAAGVFSFEVRATDGYGCFGSRSYVLTVNCPGIQINPANPNLPAVTVGAPVNAAFAVMGGTAPYTFSITNGALPAGLTLDATTGAVSGTPTTTGTFSFEVRATDVYGCSGSRAYVVTVN